MKRSLAQVLCLLALCWLWPSWAAAQEFEFHPPAAANDHSVPDVMRDLAVRILPVYEEPDTDRYLTNLAALQLVAGDYTAAYDSRRLLQGRQRSTDVGRPVDKAVLYDIYARARSIEMRERVNFAQAFTRAFKEVVPHLNDRDAHAVTVWLATPRSVFQNALQKSFDQYRARGSITFPEAVDLIWTYLSFDAYRNFSPLVDALDNEDDGNRYLIDDKVVIRTPDGAKIHATVIRPKEFSKPMPALLEFTILDSKNAAREFAAHGYVGVVAYTRGKKSAKPGDIVAFRHDGDDARAVIRWIAKQPWSDGRVGMYGDSYSGFATWAAAGRLPPALKAIATSSAMAPGIDFPMSGNIVRNSSYRWAQANAVLPADKSRDDDAAWHTRDLAWYRSGRRFLDLGHRFGTRNLAFDQWLDHPSYDRFWQKMIPYQKQFARISIPVLTTAGYYGDDAGALYYFNEHTRYRPKANHTLLIGPYDDRVTQESPAPNLKSYAIDAAAQIDLRELRYQWFDHIFKGSAKPSVLKDRVNYQVMGANEWRHAPTIAAMANASWKFYLDTAEGPRHRLTGSKSSNTRFVEQSINFADRTNARAVPTADLLVSKSLPSQDSVTFISEPLARPVEISGLLSGKLDFTLNKQDMDLNVTLYEQLPGGDYVQLFDPYEFRASYARDRTTRQLLGAGKRQRLPFVSERLTSRKLGAGSRIVLVLGVNRRPDRQINHGSGKDVKTESIADAGKPLRIRWYGSSYIEVPVRK